MILPRLNSRLSWFAHGLLGSLLLQSVTAFAQSLNWDSLIDESGGIQSHFGVALGNPAFYKRNETQSFLLASNAKLFVAAALLKRLGPDYKIETDLKWSRLRGNDPSVIENLTLVGYGDPSWGMGELGEDTTSRLNSFAQTLKTLGVKKILGDISIVASDSRWNDLAYPPGWQNDDHTQCYGALAQAVNLNLNCATFVQTSANQGHWVEDGIDVPVSMEIKPASYTYLQVQATSIGSFKIYGYFRAGSAPQNFTLPIHRAASWVHFIFGQALKNQGIAWVPAQARGTHSPLTLVTRFYSPPLSLLLQAFFKK